jgi:hypothetical protein
MILRLALIERPRQHRLMTAFLVFVGIALAVGILSIRYGVDSRIDKRNL